MLEARDHRARPVSHKETFRLERWINMADRGWFSGDHHVHAAGCAHYETPTEGVQPEDMMRHILGEDLERRLRALAGARAGTPRSSTSRARSTRSRRPTYLMRYDVEVSGFPSSHAGHLCLLRLKEDDYPGTTRIEEWPSWDLPVLQWGKSQGGVVGFSHCGWGLQVPGKKLPTYEIPPFDGIGANEYIVDVVHDAVRLHLDRRHAGPLGAEHLVSHAQLRLPCPDQRRDRLPLHLRRAVGLGRVYVKLDRRQARLRPLGARGSTTAAATSATARATWSTSRVERPGRRRDGRRAAGRACWPRKPASRRRCRVRAAALLADTPRRRTSAASRSTRSPTGTSNGPASATRARCRSR